MLLSAVSVLVIVLQSSEIPQGLMNNPVFTMTMQRKNGYKQPCCEWDSNPLFQSENELRIGQYVKCACSAKVSFSLHALMQKVSDTGVVCWLVFILLNLHDG
jgi:hypothetical protein